MLNDMMIFTKTYELIRYLHPILARFPKSEKFVLAQRIENSALELLEHIIVANSENDKTIALKKADISLEKLRIFIRLSHEFNFIAIKQYEIISSQLAEIGKMLGGWKKRFISQQ